MISESDNTASDALISALGRRTIEADLPARRRPAEAGYLPETSEMFAKIGDGMSEYHLAGRKIRFPPL